MARETRRRASSRPTAQIGGGRGPSLRTRVTPNRTARSGARSAQELADALSGINQVVSQRAREHQQEERRKEQRQMKADATKAAILDANNEVDVEQAQERAQFGDETYQRAYMKTRYGLMARDESQEMADYVREHRNEPGFNAEEYLDSRVNGLVEGLDDPDAIDAMVPRLMSDAEELKRSLRQEAVEQQKADTITSFNAWADDLVQEGVVTGQDGVQAIYKRASEMNLTREQANSVLVSSLERRAVETKDPSVLEPLFEENDDGVRLADDPRLASNVYRARERAEAAEEDQRSAEELQVRYDAMQSAERGSFTMEDAQRLQRDHPEMFNDGQLARLIQSSNEAVAAQSQQVGYQSAFRSGRFGVGAHRLPKSERQAVYNRAWQSLHAQYPDDPEKADRQFVYMLNANGGGSEIKSEQLSALLNAGGTVGPRPDGTMPPQFARGARMYDIIKQTRGASNILPNHIGDEAQQRYQMFDFYRKLGQDENEAFASMTNDVENAVGLDEFQTREAATQINRAVDDMVASDEWFGGAEDEFPGNVRAQLQKYAYAFGRHGHSAEQSVKWAKEIFQKKHSRIKGTHVYTGNAPYSDDIDDVADYKLNEMLPAVRKAKGNSDITIDELSVQPDPQEPKRLVVTYGKDEPVFITDDNGNQRQAVFNIDDAKDEYNAYRTEQNRIEGNEVRAQEQAEREAAAERRARIPSGSPRAQMMVDEDEDNQTARDAISGAFQTLKDALTQSRERDSTTFGGPPGQR